MFRRSRFSIRPNVSTAGRTAATSQEAPSANHEASETPKDAGETSAAAAVTDSKSVVTPSEKPTAAGDGNDQNGEGTSSSAAVQRRKRFSVKPKVAPGRPSALARTPKSPAKAVSETTTTETTTAEIPGSDVDKPTTSGQIGNRAAPQGLQSPRRRRPSEDSKQPKVQPKPTLISSDSPGPSAVPPAEDSPEQTQMSVDGSKQSESTSDSQVKEVPPRPPDKVPPSLPDKEATELSEKAKTLVSSKSGLSLTPPKFSLSRLLNDPSDLQRLEKARKLRELLKQEMHKEKKLKKTKARVKEYTLDPAKMTMRDLIRYLPMSNPMTSNLEDSAQENETIVPPSPEREESPERAQEPEVLPKIASPREEVEGEEAAAAAAAAAAVEDEEEEEDPDEAPMVPQVKVAEDGSLIIDEESLTVEVMRAKGPNPAQGRDPIFERGSTTTYSSFRKGTYSKPWSNEETDMFFLAISMVGTDFSMICQLFPHRPRSEIKNKFKKEERENTWRIDKAFRERRKLDIEYFSKLLEKILEVQKNRKKLKSLSVKNSPKKRKRKGKKAARKLSDVEEEDEEEESELPVFEEEEEEEEGEKENEDLCNEGGTPVSKPKRKRKRKNEKDASTEEPKGKKKQTGEKSNEQGEACIPEDAEAALPEDRTNADMSDKTENANGAKDTAIKPAKLSRGRAPKPLLPLGRKWGKKHPPASAKAKDSASDKGEESVSDGASKEQVNKDESPSRQASERKSASDNVSSEDEDYTVQPPRPTRYGRVPKPTKHLNYLAKEDAHSSASESTPASPGKSAACDAKPKVKCTTKRGRPSKPKSAQESKKPKLVTLRASQSDYSDEEDENERKENEVEEQWAACSSSKDSSAPAFVPAILRSPHPGISEVEETMEELDILANMPDVLGISQDALCPDASCERAQNETGTAEPCEHQLDLLVDVIDFLSSEHTEVSEDESYNEAAQTLLTIGNLAHLSQSAQNQTTTQDHVTEITSVSVNETSEQLEVEIAATGVAQEETSVTETSETVATVEPQNSATDKEPLSQTGDLNIIKISDETCSEQKTTSDMDSIPQLQSSEEISKKDSPQTRRGRLSKVKPKPNLGRASRTALSKSQSGTSTAGTAEESQTVAPDLSQATEIQAAAEKTTLKLAECSPALIKDDISSENQNQSFSGAQFEPSSEPATRDTDEKLKSHAGIIETGSNNPGTSDTAVTESQVEQRSNTDSVTVQESSDGADASVTPVDHLPVCQKEESEVASTNQTRVSRFQKAKPKPKLPQASRTVRSKPQTTKDSLEKDSSSSSNLESTDKTIAETESQPTCTTCPEKPSTPVLIPSLDLDSTLIPTEELSSIAEEKTDVGLVDQVDSGAAPLDQSYPEARSESTEEQLMSHVETKVSSCNNPATSDPEITESQVRRGEEGSNSPAACVTPVEELPVSQKEESEVASSCQTRRSRLQKVKPNLPQTSRTVRSKPQTTNEPGVHMQPLKKTPSPTLMPESSDNPDNTVLVVEPQPTCSTTSPEKLESTGAASVLIPSLELGSAHEPTEELSSTVEKNTNVGPQLDSSLEGSEQNVPQRRRRFARAKPNLGSSTRTTQSQLQPEDITKCPTQHSSNITSEQQPVDNKSGQTELESTEKDGKHLTSLHSENSSSSRNDKGSSSGSIVIATPLVAENQPILTDSTAEDKSSEKPTVEGESTGNSTSSHDKMEASEDGLAESKMKSILPDNVQSTPDPKESTQQQDSENESQIKSQDSVQRGSETTEANRTTNVKSPSPKCTDDTQSSRNSPQARRGRLIKPKPNLGRSSRPPQPQQVQNTPPAAETDSGTCSEDVNASGSHRPVTELQPDIQEPVEGAIEPLSNNESSLNDAGMPSGCVTQAPENSSQDASTSSAAGTESCQSIPIFPDMLSMPSDPDEPFFILSLTEIPVSSSGEVVDSTSEPPPYLPVTDASIQQQSSVPGESAAAVERVALSNVLEPVPSQETGETGLISVKDTGPEPFAYIQSSIKENPVDPHESTGVQPPKLPDTAESSEEANIPPTKQRGNGRRAKLQVKPSTTRKKQDSKTLAAKEAELIPIQANTPEDSELSGPSVQPEAFDATAREEVVTEPQKGSSDHVDTEKETGGKNPEDSSSGAQARGTSSRNRKPKGFLSFLSETDNTAPSNSPPRGKATSKGPKAKTQPAARKQSIATPVASTSRNVAPAATLTQMPEEPRSASSTTSPTLTEVDIKQTAEHGQLHSDSPPSTSQSTAEVSQQSDCVESSSIEEEPTSVSQYFLSDIFTEVDEG
ncbi:transcription factor TFIIIB component B'' homolog isoform X1 [Thunnus albacares]|uniref:transcription factor TFIIIB component B'' homolog isoform X1 n=1 Tax=Thunnus albacares TaxID=8236 RepID=UPI001CF70B0C|nr:transcription factor TFIIIB component B'' homolog isoform X1 [Thunnus albacares]